MATIIGTRRAEVLIGTPGADTIFGRARSDIITGKDGSDRLHGEAGNDRIWDAGGSDMIHGGAGRDGAALGTSAIGTQDCDRRTNAGFGLGYDLDFGDIEASGNGLLDALDAFVRIGTSPAGASPPVPRSST